MKTVRCNKPIETSAARAAVRQLCRPVQVAGLLRAVARDRGIEKPQIKDVRIERCWPGRGGAYLFEWSFDGGGPRSRLYGRCCDSKADEVHPTIVEAEPRGRRTFRRGIRSWQPRWCTMVFSSDRDPGMPHLPACLDRTEAAAVARLFPRGTSLREAHLLAYKPGRRATIRYDLRSAARNSGTARQHAAGKTFRDDRGRRVLALHEKVRSELRRTGANLSVPAPRGYVEALRLAVMEWIDVRARSDGSLGPADFVAALADLHRIEIDDLPAHTVDDECRVIRQWHAHLQVVRSADADHTWPLVEELCRRGLDIGASSSCVIHRDFYERQLLPGATGPLVIDLDTLATGDRCVDLGNLAAHLALTSVAGGERVRAEALCGEIAGLYEGLGGTVDRHCLDYFAAASLFRVAAVHAVRTSTRRCARPLMRLAADLMGVSVSSRTGVMT